MSGTSYRTTRGSGASRAAGRATCLPVWTRRPATLSRSHPVWQARQGTQSLHQMQHTVRLQMHEASCASCSICQAVEVGRAMYFLLRAAFWQLTCSDIYFQPLAEQSFELGLLKGHVVVVSVPKHLLPASSVRGDLGQLSLCIKSRCTAGHRAGAFQVISKAAEAVLTLSKAL